MTDPAGAGRKNASINGVYYIDGIHGTAYIAAPLGSVMGYIIWLDLVGGLEHEWIMSPKSWHDVFLI